MDRVTNPKKGQNNRIVLTADTFADLLDRLPLNPMNDSPDWSVDWSEREARAILVYLKAYEE